MAEALDAFGVTRLQPEGLEGPVVVGEHLDHLLLSCQPGVREGDPSATAADEGQQRRVAGLPRQRPAFRNGEPHLELAVFKDIVVKLGTASALGEGGDREQPEA